MCIIQGIKTREQGVLTLFFRKLKPMWEFLYKKLHHWFVEVDYVRVLVLNDKYRFSPLLGELRLSYRELSLSSTNLQIIEQWLPQMGCRCMGYIDFYYKRKLIYRIKLILRQSRSGKKRIAYRALSLKHLPPYPCFDFEKFYYPFD